ncbi:hypothetical protein SAMN05421819_0381 [Bryocella elongata]|uniref:Uncharacterized protein n=1 Tax=Bryocella elongata TaxID=863522 RepID=A0A1H5SYJ2_9BACT|nr:hypothetical protein [Bryocella elongata]SEF54857.1 hypothetical protein SAMN05421819_0381 [Bryocella elongata]
MLPLLLAVALATAPMHATAKVASPCPSDLRWMLEYAAPNGKSPEQNEKLLDAPCFRIALRRAFPLRYSMRGKDLTFADYVTWHLQVFSDGPQQKANRYVIIRGCVPHSCPDTGLLWIDTATGSLVFAGSEAMRPFKSDAYHLWFATTLPDRNERQTLNLPAELLDSLKDTFVRERFVSVTVIDSAGTMDTYLPTTFGLNEFETENTSEQK